MKTSDNGSYENWRKRLGTPFRREEILMKDVEAALELPDERQEKSESLHPDT